MLILLNYVLLGMICGILANSTWMIFIRRWIRPWSKANRQAIKKLVQSFGSPEVPQIILGPIDSIDNSFWSPASGMFDSDGSAPKIYIDTRYVRSRNQLIHVLLHELCHHNQYVQGRFRFGTAGTYSRRPVEREARSFDRAWFKVALRMYRAVEKRRKV